MDNFCDERELAEEVLNAKDEVVAILKENRPPEEELFEEGWRDEVEEMPEKENWYDQSDSQNLLAFLDFLAERTAKGQLKDFIAAIDPVMQENEDW